MQAGHVIPGSTTASVFGPLASESYVTLFNPGNNNVYLGATAGLAPGTDRASLYLLATSAGESLVTFQMGKGETLYAAADSGGQLDYLVFPR